MSPPKQLAEVISPPDDLSRQSLLDSSGKSNSYLESAEQQLRTNVDTLGNSLLTSNVRLLHSASNDVGEPGGSNIQETGGIWQEIFQPPYTTMAHQSSTEDSMESSTATLKPSPRSTKPHVQYLTPEDQTNRDPSPSQPPSCSTSNSSISEYNRHGSERSPTRSDAGFDEKASASEDERAGSSRSEIKCIMDQFSEEGQGPGKEEIMSPRLEIAGPLLGSPIQHPPRKSSLEPLNTSAISAHDVRPLNSSVESHVMNSSQVGPIVPPKTESLNSPTLHRPPLPEPEPDLPFDFHRFLEQLRHRTADPVARFLRSFLQEFGKKQWMVHEQVKIISDFLAFITIKMAQCEVWREVSDAEFDNAREGMEKLVMNRLYSQTFSPAIPPPQPMPASKSRRRGAERPMGPGRRGQHQEDVERDEILAQKVGIYGWVREEHLDIPPIQEDGKRYIVLAQEELVKIKTYRAPRDKIICVLNCCKVIFGYFRITKSDSSADSFMPLLIYVILHANPEHLVSNVQYILRFRNQDKLAGEAGYYLSSLLGAVQFIENLDRTTLTISDEDFERNVEAAVSAIAEKHQSEVNKTPNLSEKALHQTESAPRLSDEGQSPAPRKSTSSNEYDSGDMPDEKAAMSGLLRTIQRPLSSIGRMFSEEGSLSQGGPTRTPQSGSTCRTTPSLYMGSDDQPASLRAGNHPEGNFRGRTTAEDTAVRQAQAQAEAAEAYRIQRAEHSSIVETLAGIFPDLDREVISDVVSQKEGRVGLAVDACLALSS